VPRTRRPSFDADAFLPRLAFFERCSPDELDELAALGRYLEIPRGHGVFSAGSESAAAFVVVRGAVEVVAPCGGNERRMAVLGPGQLVGYLSVLRESRHSSSAYAREASVLLEFPAAAFREAYFGSSRASSRMRQAVQASLLASMARTNRALTRLVSQAKLDAAPRAQPQLEAALATQIMTATAEPGRAPA
jgi:CRP-like cAMP-binding protein